ncbi:hypothetical protein [Arcanobacterium bovis]|uniref:hypothetical protein n=1 Tax=Arcanobacterium bovis TaxID=2529275 RepID=UPI0013F14756|nr:hypothetical protein [Arcanobacterium bovis]
MSIYQSNLNIKDDITVTLTAKERMIIAEAIGKALPNETDFLTGAMLIDKIVKG